MRQSEVIKLLKKAGYKGNTWQGGFSKDYTRGKFTITLYEDRILVIDTNNNDYIATTLNSRYIPYVNIPYDELILIMAGPEKDIMNKLANFETERVLSSL